jgi:hypothetical protein
MDLLGALLITGIALYFIRPDLFAGLLPAATWNPDTFTQPNSQTFTQPNVATSGPLGPAQIASLASAAGFAGSDLITSVAIALAESSGNPAATGLLGEIGLWQIYPAAHPEFGPDFSGLYDPQTNAIAAFQVYQRAGNSFRPWSTYPTIYLRYLPQVQAALGVTA